MKMAILCEMFQIILGFPFPNLFQSPQLSIVLDKSQTQSVEALLLTKEYPNLFSFITVNFNLHKTRNYGPSGLRCSLRLQGDIIDIMYRFWPPKFEQREIQKHDIKQKGPKIFPLKTIIIYYIYSFSLGLLN